MPATKAKPTSKQAVTHEELDDYFEQKFPQYIQQYYHNKELDLVERVTRVEEEIKAQNQKFDLLVNQIDKRFEQIDKRFSSMQWMMGVGFTILALLMTLYNFVK